MLRLTVVPNRLPCLPKRHRRQENAQVDHWGYQEKQHDRVRSKPKGIVASRTGESRDDNMIFEMGFKMADKICFGLP